jgi:hypothetical protein
MVVLCSHTTNCEPRIAEKGKRLNEDSNQVYGRRPVAWPVLLCKPQLELEVTICQLQRAFSLAGMEKDDLLLLMQC